MSIIQDRDVKFIYNRYRHYLQAFRLKAIVSQWLHVDVPQQEFCVGNEKAQVRILVCFFFLLFLFVCVCVEMTKGLFIFCI